MATFTLLLWLSFAYANKYNKSSSIHHMHLHIYKSHPRTESERVQLGLEVSRCSTGVSYGNCFWAIGQADASLGDTRVLIAPGKVRTDFVSFAQFRPQFVFYSSFIVLLWLLLLPLSLSLPLNQYISPYSANPSCPLLPFFASISTSKKYLSLHFLYSVSTLSPYIQACLAIFFP